jgi:hypothetical protein
MMLGAEGCVVGGAGFGVSALMRCRFRADQGSNWRSRGTSPRLLVVALLSLEIAWRISANRNAATGSTRLPSEAYPRRRARPDSAEDRGRRAILVPEESPRIVFLKWIYLFQLFFVIMNMIER